MKEGRRRGEDREERGWGRREEVGLQNARHCQCECFFSITNGSIFSHLEAMLDESITFLDYLASMLGTPYSVLVMN